MLRIFKEVVDDSAAVGYNYSGRENIENDAQKGVYYRMMTRPRREPLRESKN